MVMSAYYITGTLYTCVYMYIKHFTCIFVFKLYKGFYGENLGSYILLSPKQYSEE